MQLASNVTLNQRDVDEFIRALEGYANYRKTKTYHYIINRVAKDVAAWAAHYTHRASDTALRAMLGQPAVQMKFSKRTGTMRRVKSRARHTNDAAAILAARLWKAGVSPRVYDSAQWHTKVKMFVGRTLASINFMRSGWLPAFKRLQQVVHVSSGISVKAAFGRSKEDERGIYARHAYGPLGEAIPAREMPYGLAVEIANESVNPRNTTSWSGGLGKYGPIGLEQALSKKAVDMATWVEEQMDKDAKEGGF